MARAALSLQSAGGLGPVTVRDQFLREQVRVLIGGDVLERDRLDAFRRAEILAAVGMAGIKRGADEIARGGHRVIEFGLEERELLALLDLQLASGRRGFRQHLGEDVEAGLQVGAEQVERATTALLLPASELSEPPSCSTSCASRSALRRRVPLTSRLAARRERPGLPGRLGQQAAGQARRAAKGAAARSAAGKARGPSQGERESIPARTRGAESGAGASFWPAWPAARARRAPRGPGRR